MAKDSRIKYLEELIVKMGHDPTNVQVVEDVLKKKNVDIATLRKQLKMPATKDPLAKGIEEDESLKAELLKLVVENSTQIKQMENEMEKLLKEKKEKLEWYLSPWKLSPFQKFHQLFPQLLEHLVG